MILIIKFLNYIKKIYSNIYKKYYRNVFASGGNSVIFYGNSLPIIRGETNIFLGENVKLNEFAYLYARKKSKIHIGNNTTISSFARLITAEYDLNKWIKEVPSNNIDIHIDNDIIIGNHCWIANGATILPGVHIIGNNVVVAAGAVVTKSFTESNIIIGGVPAKILKYLS